MQPRQGRLPMGWWDSQCPAPWCASPHLGSHLMRPRTVSPPPDLGGPHHSGFGSEVCQCACFFELMLQYLNLPFLEIDFSLCVSQRGKDAFSVSACFITFAPPMGAIITSVV